MSREPISKKLRFEVFKRDSFKCQYCGKSAPDVVLNVDHIMPVAKGGTNDIFNLITACESCNSGKSDRTLDDSTVIAKQKKQLDDLNERREQIEMMMEWQRELSNLDEEATVNATNFFEELLDYDRDVSPKGYAMVREWVKKFGLAEVLASMRISVDQYLKRDEKREINMDSLVKAWEYIPRICAMRKRTAGQEYKRDLYYIRGILNKRLRYVNDYKAIQIMDKAYKAGVAIEDMKDIARNVTSWSQFQEDIEAATPDDAQGE